MSDRPHGTLDFFATAIPLLWIGLVLGVSFIATPAKFQAENLDGALALAISVVTFAWLHMAEAALGVVTALLLLLTKARAVQWMLFVVAAICLALQVDWILPGFQGNAGHIPQLPTLDFRQLHAVFAATEGLKILALVGLAVLAFRGGGRPREIETVGLSSAAR